MSNVERWRPTVQWPGHEVSDLGRVRSVDHELVRSNGARYRVKGKVLTPKTHAKGHQGISARLEGTGRTTTLYVHTLVLEAFVGPRPPGMEGCHNDGNPANNHLSNLRWDTHAANEADKLRHGRNRNRNQVRCPSGHPYDEKNTLIEEYKPGQFRRRCRTCQRGYIKRWHDQHRRAS